jgi:hypothetical protein
MKKLTAIVVGGIGYVLGARAGRQRYEQIRSAALKLKNNPKVQETARQAAQTAKEAAPVVKEKVSSVAGSAADKVTPSTSTNGVQLEDSAYPPS